MKREGERERKIAEREGGFLLPIILKFVATSASRQLVINITTDRNTYIYTNIYIFFNVHVCVCVLSVQVN